MCAGSAIALNLMVDFIPYPFTNFTIDFQKHQPKSFNVVSVKTD